MSSDNERMLAAIEEPKTSDTVLQEVRRIKERLAQSQDFDIRRIMEEARENQKRSGRNILPAPARLNTG